MRGIWIVIGISLVALASPRGVQAAAAIKVKYLTAAYADATNLGMSHPEGVACMGDSFWVADTGNRRVLRYTLDEKIATPAGEVRLPDAYPVTVKVNQEGTLFVLDGRAHRIRRLSQAGKQLGLVEPQGMPIPEKMVVRNFTVGKEDQIYLLDVWGRRVVVLDDAGTYLRQVAFPTEYGAFADLAVNHHGDILLVDSVRCRVYVADAAATTFVPLTNEMKGFMSFPTAIDTDDRGTIYVLDQHGSGLVLIGPDGTYLGRQLSLGWNDAGLYYPTQLCLGGQGTLFIADRNNSRVQVFRVVWK